MSRDWQKEWKYLETKHTIPSEDDLRTSLAGPDRTAFVAHQNDALVGLALVIFRRIAQIEHDMALFRRER